MWLFSLTVNSQNRKKHTHPRQPRSAGSWLNFPQNHVELNQKSTLCCIWVPKSSFAFFVLVTFAQSRTESDRQKEAQPSYFFSMVDVDESRHGPMGPSLETWCVARGKSRAPPLCFCCFRPRACEDPRPELNWTDAASPDTCWRKNVSVNSYVTRHPTCSTASVRRVSLLHLMRALDTLFFLNKL